VAYEDIVVGISSGGGGCGHWELKNRNGNGKGAMEMMVDAMGGDEKSGVLCLKLL